MLFRAMKNQIIAKVDDLKFTCDCLGEPHKYTVVEKQDASLCYIYKMLGSKMTQFEPNGLEVCT